MHFSAKRGLAITCRLSVSPSVTLMDWFEFFENNITVSYRGAFALCRPQHQGSTPRGTPQNFGPNSPTFVDLSVGDIPSQIAAEWSQMAQGSQWRAYSKPPSLFRMVPSPTPTNSPFPLKWGFHMPQDTWMAISPQWVIWYTSCLVLELGFQGRWIEWHYFRLHQIQVGGRPPSWIILNGHTSTTTHLIHYIARIARSVIFAIAQLSCSVNCAFCVFLQYFDGWVFWPVKTVARKPTLCWWRR